MAIATVISVMLCWAAASSRAVEAPAADEGPISPSAEGAQIVLAGGGDRDYRFKRSEKCFMRRINRIRHRHGKGDLHWDRHLGVVGRKHARRMARAGGGIWHDDIGNKVTRWRSLGQNTGMGGGCKRLTRAFMHSSSHRANYLGRWRHVGVGVVTRNGSTYVQQVFESRNNPGNIWHKP